MNAPLQTRELVAAPEPVGGGGVSPSSTRAPAPLQLLMRLAIASIAITWPLYVAHGSQAAYLLAVAASCTVSAGLAYANSRVVVLLLVAEVGVLGTEASGALAPGHAWLGSLRLTDATVAAAILGLTLRWLRARKRASHTVVDHRFLGASALRARASGSPVTVLLLGLAAWMVVLWAAHGSPRDAIARADFRAVLLAAGCWLVGVTCWNSPPRDMARALAYVGPFIAAKATAIYFSGAWAIGDLDRLQAVTDRSPTYHLRVILESGGDPLLIIVPALAVLAIPRANSSAIRLGLVFSAAAALWGVAVSGTRTSLIVAVALAAACMAYLAQAGLARLVSRRIAVVGVPLFALGLAGAAMATGLAGRLTSGDQPHGGINFRADEVSRFFAQHATDVVLGKGFGGRFLSVSGNGGTVITGWTHAFPLWIILKVGLAGLVVACVAARLAARRVIRRYRSDPPRRDMLALGSAIVAGILVMSLTLGVAALADGAMLLGFGGAFLSGPRPRRTRWALA